MGSGTASACRSHNQLNEAGQTAHLKKGHIVSDSKENTMTIESLLHTPELKAVCTNKNVIRIRHKLAEYTATQFLEVSSEIVRQNDEKSAEKYGKAISILLQIGAALISGSNHLLLANNSYAALALIRQLVEVEYLAWAFEDNKQEAEKWINSNKEERIKFFTPAKLRKAAKGRFRGIDYEFHCEFGGHPVPRAVAILSADVRDLGVQLMLSDMLGHSGRIWDHFVKWADGKVKQDAILSRSDRMLERYVSWKQADPLTRLPPPPEEALKETLDR